MKTLTNLKVVLMSNTPAYMTATNIGYVQLCVDCLKNIKTSATSADLVARQRVITIIQNTDVSIELDDDIIVLIKRCVAEMEWKRFDIEIIGFCNYIEGL